MKWEYRQLQVPVSGWLNLSLPQSYLAELNRLAQQGWRVDQVITLQVGMGTTNSVIFLLKREIQ